MTHGKTMIRPGTRRFRMIAWLLVGMFSLFLAGCDPDEESILVGTGFKGTVSERKQLASLDIEIRAQSGERFTALISVDGQYSVESASGSGPWLLRSNLGNNEYRYGIAYASGIANVHSYTDVVLRSWFLKEHGLDDLDTAFDADGQISVFPNAEQFFDLAENYFALVDLVLQNYNLSGSQLLNEEFRADGSGIDRYLNLNPVLIDGRRVTLIRTDPDNNTQTATTIDILAGADSGQPDSQAPSIPENLRALSSGPNEIVLVWEPSTDNLAIVGYEIIRNGELVELWPYPVYTDSDVQADTAYDYVVKAIDVAGNRSAEASISITGTLTMLDTERPPAPTALKSVFASLQRVDLEWTQGDIGDVAGFNVYRGQPQDIPSLLISVTSTSVTDATVSANQEYCYQVSAVDASGNESEKTDLECVVTDGITIVTPERPVADVPTMAGLSYRDPHLSSCPAIFPDYRVNSELTVPEGCYRVERDIVVVDSGILTLDPGVVLMFLADTQLLIESDGVLISIGTEEDPVIMTAEQPISGQWRGVLFNRSNDARNVIRRTVVEYTGSDSSGAAITLVSSENSPSRLRVEQSLIRFGQWYGISIPGLDSKLDSFSGNRVEFNGRAAFLHYTALRSLNNGSVFIDNDTNRLFVPGATYNTDVEIDDPGLPIQLNDMNQTLGTIIINKGVELYFTNNTALHGRSSLAIRGSAEKPVILNSTVDAPGSWQGLLLIEGVNAEISHVIIKNAGRSSPLNPEGANLFANNATFSLNNVILTKSESFGFHATGDQVTVSSAERFTSDNNAREDVVSPYDF
ncbi:MAG: fibronectin type III domain-containing protein [Granulosicoccus sp.]